MCNLPQRGVCYAPAVAAESLSRTAANWQLQRPAVAAKAFTAHTNHDYNDARRKVSLPRAFSACVFWDSLPPAFSACVFGINCPVRCWVSLPRAFLGLIAPVRFPACVLKLNAAVVLSKILPVTTYHRWVDRVGTSLLKTHV